MGEISIPIVEALPMIEPFMAIHCMAAERGGLIKKKKRKFMGKT